MRCFDCLRKEIYVAVIINCYDVDWMIFTDKDRIIDVVNEIKKVYETDIVSVASINEKKVECIHDKLISHTENTNAVCMKVNINDNTNKLSFR